MFTTEFDHDEICITILDESGQYEDVIINAFDDIVYIRQWDEDIGRMESIAMSPQQWEELIAALHTQEGTFKTIK